MYMFISIEKANTTKREVQFKLPQIKFAYTDKNLFLKYCIQTLLFFKNR